MSSKFVVFSDSADYERYWTGETDGAGIPEMTKKVEKAAQFPTASNAYQAAAPNMIMQFFRVGRRPTPVNLRGLFR